MSRRPANAKHYVSSEQTIKEVVKVSITEREHYILLGGLQLRVLAPAEEPIEAAIGRLQDTVQKYRAKRLEAISKVYELFDEINSYERIIIGTTAEIEEYKAIAAQGLAGRRP